MFNPPYIYNGLYERENALRLRSQLEAPNRTTIRLIFEQRAENKRRVEEWQRLEWNHNRGIHSYGFCPFCPANLFYD